LWLILVVIVVLGACGGVVGAVASSGTSTTHRRYPGPRDNYNPTNTIFAEFAVRTTLQDTPPAPEGFREVP
jgi:hypothetical protein